MFYVPSKTVYRGPTSSRHEDGVRPTASEGKTMNRHESGHAKMAQFHRMPFIGIGNDVVRAVRNDGRG